jgi:cytosine/adenosine deaminase-related metal-dependent hydrolase
MSVKSIKASYLYTPKGIIEDGQIIIENDQIIDILDSSNALNNKIQDIEIKNNFILFPGFINTHCHLELTAVGPIPEHHLYSKDKSEFFVNWIQELVKSKNLLTEDEKIKGIKKGIDDLLLSGVTTLGDHVSFNTPLDPIINSPLKGKIFAETIGAIDEVSQDIYHHLCQIKENWQHDRFDYQVIPHSVHAVYPDTLKKCFNEQSSPLSCHLAESQAEFDYFDSKSGPMANLVRNMTGNLPYTSETGLDFINKTDLSLEKLLLIHGNYLSTDDFKLLADKSVSIVHCPGSWEYFKHQNFNLEGALNHHINIAIGTDSIASNTKLNFLHELKLIREKYPNLNAKTILDMATINGAKALEIDHQVGSIEIGKKADLVGFRIKNNEENPLDLPFTNEKVDFLMIDGKTYLS